MDFVFKTDTLLSFKVERQPQKGIVLLFHIERDLRAHIFPSFLLIPGHLVVNNFL
jgi:hypothetical protein